MAEAQATTQVRNDGPDWTCPVCGEVKKAKGRAGHMKSHEEFRQSEEAMDRPPQPPAVRARRGYKPRGADTSLSPLQQIRREPTVLSGAGAYYLDKDGATIRDALIYYPNGATEAEVGRYGQNSEYYQSRQATKGFKYLGATLGPDAIKELVSTLVSNRPDEIAITQYRMDECDYTLRHSGVQKEREVAAKRRQQFAARLDMLQQKINVTELIQQLEEIGEAQTIAKLDGPTRKAMELLLKKQNQRVLELVSQLGKRERGMDAELGVKPAAAARHDAAWDSSDEEFAGVDSMMVDNDDD